jgi:predicted outer membrane protein
MKASNMERIFPLTALFLIGFAGLVLAWTGKAGPGDAEALRVVAAIDRNEIEASDAALAKNVAPNIMDFARMMKKDHGDNLDKTRSLAARLDAGMSEDSATVTRLRSDGAKDVELLKALDGRDFETAYMRLMVQGHTDALATLKDLSGKATHADVKAFLRDTQKAVEMHLKHAKREQAGLKA